MLASHNPTSQPLVLKSEYQLAQVFRVDAIVQIMHKQKPILIHQRANRADVLDVEARKMVHSRVSTVKVTWSVLECVIILLNFQTLKGPTLMIYKANYYKPL